MPMLLDFDSIYIGRTLRCRVCGEVYWELTVKTGGAVASKKTGQVYELAANDCGNRVAQRGEYGTLELVLKN